MTIVLLLITILIGLALSKIFFYKATPRTMKRPKYPLPPGPPSYLIVGCLPEMVRNKPAFRWMHAYMQALDTEIASFRLGGTHVIVVSSPDLAREFLKEHDAVLATRPNSMSARITSIGFLSAVLTPGGDQWKKMRRVMVSEVLSTSMHERLHTKRCVEADRLVRDVYDKQWTNGGVVNVREAARLYCSRVIRRCVFGNDGEWALEEEEKEHTDALFKTLLYLYGFAICDYVPFLERFDLDGHKKYVSNAVEHLRKYQDPIIDARVEMWRNGVRNTNDDILDVLITLNNSNNEPLLSIQEIRAQVNEILLAAVDNPSNAIEWALAEMIIEPRILDSASRELDRVVGRKRLVQESDLSQLNYIKACVKEAMRLHPVAPFNLPHVSTADAVVGGRYFIPKGSHVMLSRFGLGRNPRVWEDPLRFKPERHIPNEFTNVIISDPELHMLSFSSGRRGCPGIKLGSTMTTMLLARLIQSFNWCPPSGDVAAIDFAESHGDLTMASPLLARATPRLEPHLYV